MADDFALSEWKLEQELAKGGPIRHTVHGPLPCDESEGYDRSVRYIYVAHGWVEAMINEARKVT